MESLKAKLKKQGGFTLIEMLIVVAIIAILIAISIPLVNGALEKARDSTDEANERAAKAITLLYFMGATDDEIDDSGNSNSYTPGTEISGDSGTAIYYDAKSGNLSFDMPEAYGQCTGRDTCYQGTSSTSHIGQVIRVTITDKGIFTPKWVNVT